MFHETKAAHDNGSKGPWHTMEFGLDFIGNRKQSNVVTRWTDGKSLMTQTPDKMSFKSPKINYRSLS